MRVYYKLMLSHSRKLLGAGIHSSLPDCLHLSSLRAEVVVLDRFSLSFVRGLSKGRTVTWCG